MVEKIDFESAAYLDGETKKLEFSGNQKTVLAFFPGAFTSVCTEEMKKLQEMKKELDKNDCQIIGISVDTPFALEEFAKQKELDFPLISDTNKSITENYNVKTEMPGLGYEIAKRAVFLVEDNEIIYKEILEDPSNLPNLEKLKEEAI